MYNDYFGFQIAPFSIAPNPHFLYMSERHREALAHLLYGIRSDGGFILLTGEVGTGKTTVCRCLLEQIPEDVDTAFVLNPKLTATELLATACDDLGVCYPEGASIKQLVDALNAFLLESLENGRRTVLIIDEAQNLSTDVLEQLRLLTNLETNQRKLLQIILLGQPELLEILDRQDMRQLAQRITARFHLGALDKNEVASYIAHRVELAGGNPALFSKAAVRRISQLSGGIPRLINLICDRALLGTYSRNQLRVEPGVVDRAAREFFGREAVRQPRWPMALAAVALIVAVPFVVQLLRPAPATEPAATVAETAAMPETPIPSETASESEAEVSEPIITGSVRPLEPATDQPDSLLDVRGDTSAARAMEKLFSAWQAPIGVTDGDPCETADRYQLSCFSMLGSLRDLQALNHPAVIRLSLARENHYLAVTGIDDNIVTVTSSNGSYRLRKQDILNTWDGRFTVLWQPPPDYRALSRGDRGPVVEQLSRQLAAVSSSPISDTFDAALEDRLKRFQVSRNLTPDGIAGVRTWILLNQATGSNAPTLTDRGRG